MANLLQKLSLGKPVDKNGPRTLLIISIGPHSAKCVLLSRNGYKVTVEGTERVVIDTQQDDLIKQLCKQTGLKSKYCSVILKERDEQVRLMRIPSRLNAKQDIQKFIAETFGADRGFGTAYQFVGDGKDDSEKLLLAGLLNKEKSQKIRKEVEGIGSVPVSLGLESVALINLSLDLSADDQVRAFLYIGDISSILTVTVGQRLQFVRTFPHGKQCVVESVMNGMMLEEEEAEQIFADGTENFSAYMDMEVVSWMHQIALSLDFVERDFGQVVENVCVYGSGAKSNDLREMLGQQTFRKVSQPDLEALFKDRLSTSGLGVEDQDFLLPIVEGAEIMLGDLNDES